MSEQKFYCPKCGKKKLTARHRWQSSSGGYYRIYECHHNEEPKTWRGRRNWDKEKNPPCGVVIEANGRDAEIDDYGSVIDKMARINVPQIQQWLLKNDSTVRKQGIDVLYEGEMADLVRRADDDGVGVAIYWKAATWDEDPDVVNPLKREYDWLRAEASHYLDHQGMQLAYLFTGHPVLWSKGEDPESAVFKGKTLGKKLKQRLINFTKSVESNFDQLVKQARSETDRWVAEKEHFLKSLHDAVPGQPEITVHHYNGDSKTASISLNRGVTVSEAIELEKILGAEIELDFSFGSARKRLRPAVAQTLVPITVTLTGSEPTFKVDSVLNLGPDYYGQRSRRVNLDEALQLVRLLG